MGKKKYEADDLIDFIQTWSEIECSTCGGEQVCSIDDENYFFGQGWRATKSNVYCPECAKKKLKL